MHLSIDLIHTFSICNYKHVYVCQWKLCIYYIQSIWCWWWSSVPAPSDSGLLSDVTVGGGSTVFLYILYRDPTHEGSFKHVRFGTISISVLAAMTSLRKNVNTLSNLNIRRGVPLVDCVFHASYLKHLFSIWNRVKTHILWLLAVKYAIYRKWCHT